MKRIGVYELLLDVIVTVILLAIFQFDIYFRKYLVAFLVLQYLCGRYQNNSVLIWDEINLLLKSHILFFIFTVLIAPRKFYTFEYIGRLVLLCLVSFFLLVVLTRAMHIVLRPLCKKKTLVFGVGKTANNISETIAGNRFTLMDIQAYVNCNELNYRIQKQRVDESKTIYFHDLQEYLKHHSFDCVIYAIPSLNKEELGHLIDTTKDLIPRQVYIPRIEGMISFNSKIRNFDGIVLISNASGFLRDQDAFLKRILDIIGGLIGTLFCIPLTIFVFFYNRKCNDKGPIFFVQKRIGKNGKTFRMFKYRTMVVGADKKLKEMLENDPEVYEEYMINKKLKEDPRVTEAGAFLRRLSLDEFPQFFNVLIGNMSLVGPRPYLHREKKDMKEYYNIIIKTKPGITGMWQTHGRSDVTFQERLELDEYYYRNWNIGLDMQLLLRTIQAVVRKSGAQ